MKAVGMSWVAKVRHDATTAFPVGTPTEPSIHVQLNGGSSGCEGRAQAPVDSVNPR
jgi:hypothetical protein